MHFLAHMWALHLEEQVWMPDTIDSNRGEVTDYLSQWDTVPGTATVIETLG